VQKGQQDVKGAGDDMERAGHLATRSKSLCELQGLMSVSNWTGWVEEKGATDEGNGILKIKIANKIFVRTHDTELEDLAHEFTHDETTLIKPGTDLFDNVVNLKQGQEVKFSGKFFEDDGSCIEDYIGFFEEVGDKLKSPDFNFAFSDIAPL